MDDLKWFIGVLVILAVAWFASGGLNSPSARDPFILPPAPISEQGGTYGGPPRQERLSSYEIGEEIKRAETEAKGIQEELARLQTTSPLQGKLFIDEVYTGGNEHITLRAAEENTSSVLLTGLRLRSQVTGRSVSIGTGAILPYLGVVNNKDQILLPPGGIAYVMSGRSPIGTSFQTNRCTGYFSQYQDFDPSLPLECPRPENQPRPSPPNNLNDECIDYLESMGTCRAEPVPPSHLQHECRTFISENMNYNICVDRYKNTRNFYTGEWRIYLGQSETLWKTRRETIELVDQNGKLIDARSY